jgi:HEAT repeat protein
MPVSLVPTRAFSHLVWLLVYRPAATPEQKEALRELLLALRSVGCVLSLAELNRAIAAAVQMQPAPEELPWLGELAARMAAHSVSLLDFAAQATAADVLAIARVLASEPEAGDEGVNFDARLLALQLTTVAVRLGRGGFVRRATPASSGRVGPARTPVIGIAAIEPTPATSEAVRSAGIGLPTPTTPMPAYVGDDATSVRDEEPRILEAAFTRGMMGATHQDLLGRLDAAPRTSEAVSPLLDELVRLAEGRSRDAQWGDVAEILQGIVGRERNARETDEKRAYLIQLRRLFKPGILRGLGQLLGRERDRRLALTPVFVRAGDAGAEILIELMVSSHAASERRAYRSVLAQCPAAAEPLANLLDDGRWFVVRNAAELLGEMGIRAADATLIATLKHPDARVRRAAAGALTRLGTVRGVNALQHLLGDTNAAVRLQAINGLVSARHPRSAPALIQALDHEVDPELQHALLHALGAHPTDAAVDRLVAAAQSGSLLNRKPTAYRVAAVAALGDAATAVALAALRQLQRDKDREVGSAAERALSAHAQGVLAAASAGGRH